MLIFYVIFDDCDSPSAIACQGFVEDPVLPESLRLIGVEGIQDTAFPDLEITELVIRKKDIHHYVRGNPKPKLEVVEPPLQMNRPPPPPRV